jgi:hypothetical protein
MRYFKPEVLMVIPIPYDAPVENLRGVVVTPGPKTWAAIYSLAHKEEQEALITLAELTRSPDWTFRRSAIEAIGIHPSGQTMVEGL